MIKSANRWFNHLVITSKTVGLACVISIAPAAFSDDTVDPEKADFEKWLDGVRSEAREKGISEETIKIALTDVNLLKRVIVRDTNQPEVKQTYGTYLTSRVSEWRIENGRKMITENAELFAEIAEQYGVQQRFVAAIWGIETNYGTYDLTIPVFDAIATLAYNPRRASRFRRELFASLKIVENGEATVDMMMGSWAGAMGQPQFMPETYVAYAKDHDGDGLRDIWNNKGDVFASIATYLKHYGWNDSQTWGRQVMLPKGSETSFGKNRAGGVTADNACKRYTSMGAWRPLSEWQSLGIRRLNGDDLPKRDLAAALIIGDEGDDKGYLVYRNFCSVLKYNPSFKYALGVSMLADQIKGGVQ